MKIKSLLTPCVATLAAFAFSLTSGAQEMLFALADLKEFGGAGEGPFCFSRGDHVLESMS